jgi:hypothetical protein
MEYQVNLPNNVVIIVRNLNENIEQIDDIVEPPLLEQPPIQPNYKSNSSVDFIRDTFLLKQKGLIKERNTKLFESYKLYCQELSIEPFNKEAFYKHLKEVGIKTRAGRYGGYKLYNISFDELKEIAEKYNNFEDDEKNLRNEIERLNEIINNFPSELEKQRVELEKKYEQILNTLKEDYLNSFLRLQDNISIRQVEDIDIDNDTFEKINLMVAEL